MEWALLRLLLFGMALTLAGCSKCVIEPFGSSVSPSGAMILQLERQNCGATTGFLYKVVAYEKGDTDGTMILEFDGHHGRFGWPSPWEDHKLLNMKWLGSSQVQILMNYPARVYYDRKAVDDVAVRVAYKPGTTRGE